MQRNRIKNRTIVAWNDRAEINQKQDLLDKVISGTKSKNCQGFTGAEVFVSPGKTLQAMRSSQGRLPQVWDLSDLFSQDGRSRIDPGCS